jgi:ubiquinone biosynthesis protein
MSIRKYFATAGRLIVITTVLAHQWLADLPRRLPSAVQPSSRRRINRYLATRQPKISAPQRARETLERLGPSFVKFGQFLSVRPDLVPIEYCAEFRKLQDEVPAFPVALVREELARELRRDPDEVFAEFDDTPVAAASVAQVHRARLRTGEEVAVKVQRPNVRERMEEDILIMLFVAHVLERLVAGLRKNRLVMLVHEFSRWTARELDFRREAQNALLSAYHFADYPGVKIPSVNLPLSTERVLVMEFVRGSNILDAPPGTYDRGAVARLVADSMLKQIFVDGFFHGDPHAGNIFLLPDGRIAYVDFGIVGYLAPKMREWAFEILHSMSEADIPRVIDAVLELCDADEEQIDIPAYRREMNEVLTELHVSDLARIPFTHLMQRFLNTSLEFGLDVPPDFVIMSKAITTLEGTCTSLDPELRIADCLRPFVEKYAASVPDLDELVRQLKQGPFELNRLRRMAEKHGRRVLRLLDRPTVRIEGTEFRRAVRELEKTSMNVVSGLLIAALIVFAATVSNSSEFERWLSRTLHLPVAPLLSIASLGIAAYLWVRLFARSRPERGAERPPRGRA